MTIWKGEAPLVLASQSSARKNLLASAGLSFQTLPADIDERGIQARSGLRDPAAVAALLATEKALHVSRMMPGQFVIGADQTLALNEQLFSKPAGHAQAAEQIARLAGQTHGLHSAVSVARDGVMLFSEVSIARMTMRPLTAQQIADYLDTAGEVVTTSVGAYQLESFGVHLFTRIEGDHFTILGLPMLPLLKFFRRENLLAI